MKHEFLEEIWRVRDEISAECDHDLDKLSAMLKREAIKHPDRIVKLPIVHKTKIGEADRPS